VRHAIKAAIIEALKNLLARVDAGSSEDQEALVEAARGIEAERTGVYEATAEELAAIDRGVDDVRRGRLAAVEALAEVRAKFRSG
jgi:hypothetical protein